MVKSQQEDQVIPKPNKTKYNRFDEIISEVDPKKRTTWPASAVVYIGHLPHGFYEAQLLAYFTQYGEVLSVKVARSRKTARSKGYAFIQFKYPEVANIVAETMNGYMLMGKVLVANVLNNGQKNPFGFSTSKHFKFINWKRIFLKERNKVRTEEEIKKEVGGLLRNEEQKREKLRSQGISYEYPGFAECVTKK